MEMNSQTITKVILTGTETLKFIKDNIAEIIQLSPEVKHFDIFEGINIFLKFDQNTYFTLMQQKGMIPQNGKLQNFQCKPDGGIELEFV